MSWLIGRIAEPARFTLMPRSLVADADLGVEGDERQAVVLGDGLDVAQDSLVVRAGTAAATNWHAVNSPSRWHVTFMDRPFAILGLFGHPQWGDCGFRNGYQSPGVLGGIFAGPGSSASQLISHISRFRGGSKADASDWRARPIDRAHGLGIPSLARG